MNTLATAAPRVAASSYSETRRHELRKSRMLMVDGSLVANLRTVEAGASARVYEAGYWGFASTSASDPARVGELTDLARRNARAMSKFGARQRLDLPSGRYRGEHEYRGRQPLSAGECTDRLAEIHAWATARYPDLKSTRLLAADEHHRKQIATSEGSDAVVAIQRALCYVTFIAEDERGAPVEVTETLSGKGHLGDLEWSLEALAPRLEALHGHLQAKRRAVAARGGTHRVVMAPQLAGILAHEAMGHPCEADLVLGGAVTRDLVGQRVASDLVTMIDFAHTCDGREVEMPVYCDDEGTPARDAVLIRDGALTQFMSSRETAARLGIPATGSARAYGPGDEPLVRMRNTAILPGTSKLDDMVAGIEDGYLLLRTGNGQADSTTEFMFAITLAYEVRGGRIGRAIRDTTISGSAIKVLQSVDAVSDDMHWSSGGYCGKKQPMVVAMGGPALRAQVHVGGQ
jgi:TldD protein